MSTLYEKARTKYRAEKAGFSPICEVYSLKRKRYYDTNETLKKVFDCVDNIIDNTNYMIKKVDDMKREHSVNDSVYAEIYEATTNLIKSSTQNVYDFLLKIATYKYINEQGCYDEKFFDESFYDLKNRLNGELVMTMCSLTEIHCAINGLDD